MKTKSLLEKIVNSLRYIGLAGIGTFSLYTGCAEHRKPLIETPSTKLAQRQTEPIEQMVCSLGKEGSTNIGITNLKGDKVLNQILLTNSNGCYESPSWSQDGNQIVFSVRHDTNSQIGVMNADGTNRRELTHDPNCYNSLPTWLPDGRIGYTSSIPNENSNIFVIKIDGTKIKMTSKFPENSFPAWSRDGKKVAITVREKKKEPLNIWIGDYNEKGLDESTLRRVTNDQGNNWGPSWSPDGKWFAYTRTLPTGKSDVWVSDIDGNCHISLTDGKGIYRFPSFVHDGRIIFSVQEKDNTYSTHIINSNGTGWKRLTEGYGSKFLYKK